MLLPRPNFDNGDHEVFATWKALYEEISDEYLTDANGYDLIRRPIYESTGRVYFSREFYPVDSSITIMDGDGTNSLTVWNDRPQGGSV